MSVRFVMGACTYLYKLRVPAAPTLGAQGFTQGAARAQQSLQNRPDVDTRDILEATSQVHHLRHDSAKATSRGHV